MRRVKRSGFVQGPLGKKSIVNGETIVLTEISCYYPLMHVRNAVDHGLPTERGKKKIRKAKLKWIFQPLQVVLKL